MSSKDDLAHAMDQIDALIAYLGKAPDGRLQANFSDAGHYVAPTAAHKICPPCGTYAEFLERITSIRGRLERSEPLETAPLDWRGQQAEGLRRLNDPAFVLWARDFLAGVAAPATVESIRLTHAYIEKRKTNWRFFTRSLVRILRFLCPWKPDATASIRQLPQRSSPAGVADMLASRVACLVGLTLGTVVVTVGISTYALSGHLLLQARAEAVARQHEIEQELAHIEQGLSDARLMLPNGRSLADVASITHPVLAPCDDIRVEDRYDGKTISSGGDHHPSIGPIPDEFIYIYKNVDQISACARWRRSMMQLFGIGEQIVSWNRVASGTPLGLFFGVSSPTIKEFSSSPEICPDFAGDSVPVDLKLCRSQLHEIMDYYGAVTGSILSCLTMYILPCLYGFLGASAATMRYLKHRIDNFSLSYTDMGFIRQTTTLGVVAGAVIGLFAVNLVNAAPAEGLGVSAVAFLAGFNVPGLFEFLENLSNRLFRSNPTPAH